MPIKLEPLRPTLLCDVLDPLGLTLVIREDLPDEWNAYMIDSSGIEYDLFDEWDVECQDSAQAVLDFVADSLSNAEADLGDIVLDCTTLKVLADKLSQ